MCHHNNSQVGAAAANATTATGLGTAAPNATTATGLGATASMGATGRKTTIVIVKTLFGDPADYPYCRPRVSDVQVHAYRRYGKGPLRLIRRKRCNHEYGSSKNLECEGHCMTPLSKLPGRPIRCRAAKWNIARPRNVPVLSAGCARYRSERRHQCGSCHAFGHSNGA